MGERLKLARSILTLSIILSLALVTAWPTRAATRYEVGIATSATLLRMKDDELIERLNNIKQLGANWLRIDFSWRAIQPDNPDQYEWEEYDRLVRIANEHNFKILAVINYTPAWARQPECAAKVKYEEAAKKCVPRSNEEFGRFVRALAIRYKGTNIRGWEIWNEPNLTGHWKSVNANNKLTIDPKAYAELANMAATQIRHNYLDSVIITGGLAPMFESKPLKGMRQSDYLAELLPLLKPEFFDGIAIHPYSWPLNPGVTENYNAFYTVDNGKPHMNLRNVMAKAGWGEKEIWGTEYGASTKGLRRFGLHHPQGRPDHVSESVQARIIEEGLDLWYTKENVGPLFVHSDSDKWLIKSKNESGFGLRRTDGTKKPAHDALQQASERVTSKADQ